MKSEALALLQLVRDQVAARHPGTPVRAGEPLAARVKTGSAATPVEAAPTHSAQHNPVDAVPQRSEEHTSELQSLMRISYAVFCLKKKKTAIDKNEQHQTSHTIIIN